MIDKILVPPPLKDFITRSRTGTRATRSGVSNVRPVGQKRPARRSDPALWMILKSVNIEKKTKFLFHNEVHFFPNKSVEIPYPTY